MQLQVLEHRQAELAARINALRAVGGDGDENEPGDEEEKQPAGSRAGSGGQQQPESQAEASSHRSGPNIIYNQEEMEDEQEERSSGPN